MHWNMTQITDPKFRTEIANRCEELYGLVDIELADGHIKVGVRQAIINLFFWEILVAFNIPICKHHWVKRVPLNNGNIFKYLTKYYNEIMKTHPGHGEQLKVVIFKFLNHLYKFASENVLSYSSSIDMIDMAEIMTDQPMQDIIDTKEKIVPEWGTNVIEKYVDTHSKEIMKLLGTNGALQNDALLRYQRLGLLNKFQVPQSVYAFGVRTDINDGIIRYPVKGSAAEGLRDANEYAVESLTAKKSSAYHGSAIQSSQYTNRKTTLVAKILEHIYPYDCYSNIGIEYHITKEHYAQAIGKNIFWQDKILELTAENIHDFVDKTVLMRSPMTCRYTKGICPVCGGSIMRNIHPSVNIGMLSSIRIMEPTTQKILSAKHLVKTNSIPYELLTDAAKILYCSSINEIRWRPDVYNKVCKFTMGIPLKCISNLHDITLMRLGKVVKEEKFSNIEYFVLRNEKGKENTYLMQNEKQTPYLSFEFLLYIRDHFNELKISDDFVYIPLENTDKFPIFKTLIQNDSTLLFVASVNNFLSSKIKDYTSCSEALKDFSEIIYSKVPDINLTHIEILLKAFMIYSDEDYRIPVVKDPNHVRFSTVVDILNNRSLGAKLAFQGLNAMMTNPQTYLNKRQTDNFDLMIGYTDY